VNLWKEAHAALRGAWPARAFTAAPTAEAAADTGVDRPMAPPLPHMHVPRVHIPVVYYTNPYSPHKL
jgi:hypothetical protein